MPPKKNFSELQARQQRRIVDSIYELFLAHCPTAAEATALLDKVFAKCQEFLPQFSTSNALCSQLVGSLGCLRNSVAEVFTVSRVASPSLSIAQLDRALCQLPLTRAQLNDWGYPVGVRSYANACREEDIAEEPRSQRNPGGRPSKVNDEELHALLRKVLDKYLLDSERIVVIGRRAKRKMVLAKHLTKKRFTIYKAEPQIHKAMNKDVFRKILKIHFPHVRDPRRLTDVCNAAVCLSAGNTFPLFSCGVVSFEAKVMTTFFTQRISGTSL